MENKNLFMAFWFMLGLTMLGFSHVVLGDEYHFHDGFNQQFNDSNNWTLTNRNAGNFVFVNHTGRTMVKVTIDPDGSNAAMYQFQYNEAVLLTRTLPSNFNFTEINITAVLDVSELFAGSQHGGIGFFNESMDFSPSMQCSSGMTPESYDFLWGQNKSTSTNDKLWSVVDDYPSSFGDSGTGDDWVNHVLRLQLKKYANNNSLHIACFYTNLGGLAGNSTIYNFGVGKEFDVPIHLFANLSFGVLSTMFNANENGPNTSILFDDFYIDATGNFSSGAPPIVTDSEPPLNTSWTVQSLNVRTLTFVTAWNTGGAISLNTSLLNFSVNASEPSNMSCRFDVAQNYSEMVLNSSSFKANTLNVTLHKFKIEGFSEGVKCLYCSFKDNFGNEPKGANSSSGCLNVSYNTAPGVTVTAPLSGVSVVGLTNINWTAGDIFGHNFTMLLNISNSTASFFSSNISVFGSVFNFSTLAQNRSYNITVYGTENNSFEGLTGQNFVNVNTNVAFSDVAVQQNFLEFIDSIASPLFIVFVLLALLFFGSQYAGIKTDFKKVVYFILISVAVVILLFLLTHFLR